MNKKGILFMGLFIVIVFLFAGVVSADDGHTIEINGISFNIPQDYELNPNVGTIDEIKTYGNISINESHKAFSDKDGKHLGITVDSYNDTVTLESLKITGDEKTFGSVSGIHSYDGLNFFKYLKDGKLVTITYDDESIVEGVIN